MIMIILVLIFLYLLYKYISNIIINIKFANSNGLQKKINMEENIKVDQESKQNIIYNKNELLSDYENPNYKYSDNMTLYQKDNYLDIFFSGEYNVADYINLLFLMKERNYIFNENQQSVYDKLIKGKHVYMKDIIV